MLLDALLSNSALFRFVSVVAKQVTPPAPADLVAALRRNFPLEAGHAQALLRSVSAATAADVAATLLRVAPDRGPWVVEVIQLLRADNALPAPEAPNGTIKKTA